MSSGSSGTVSKRFERLGVVIAVVVLGTVCLTSVGTGGPDELALVKARVLAQIRDRFAGLYFGNPGDRGATVEMIVKDFAPGDEETYAIDVQGGSFWVVRLPWNRRYDAPRGATPSRELKVDKVRPELVAATRAQAVRMTFTVPTSYPLKIAGSVREGTSRSALQEISAEFALLFASEEEKRGRIVELLIKPFSPHDERTYAMLEDEGRFWVLTLPALNARDIGFAAAFTGEEFRLQAVPADLVSLTKAKGLRLRVAVPSSGP